MTTPTPDLSHFWMPFTANRRFKDAPRLFESAKGMYYTTVDGREVLDATAGLWCVNAGHCREEIVQAVTEQMSKMDFAPTFQMGHPLAFEAASKVAELMPAGLDRIFFTNSGSESVDTALKWCWPITGRGARASVRALSVANAVITALVSAAFRSAVFHQIARHSRAA